MLRLCCTHFSRDMDKNKINKISMWAIIIAGVLLIINIILGVFV